MSPLEVAVLRRKLSRIVENPANGLPFSPDEIEILRKRTDDRHFEELRRFRVDDDGTTRRQEPGDLILHAAGDRTKQRVGVRRRPGEQVRALRHGRILRERQIVPVVHRPVLEAARAICATASSIASAPAPRSSSARAFW